jgi:membrane protein DedA with SNARE-associated domain
MSEVQAQERILPLSWREGARRIRVQLAILFLLFIVYLLGAWGSPKTNEQWLAMIFGLIKNYGAAAVALVSFLENLGAANVVFPGSIAILTSMALTSGDPRRAIYILLAIMLPAFAAHQINYTIGRCFRRGNPDNKARYESLVARNLVFMGALWHPHFAGVACMDAGAHGLQYGRFISAFLPWFIVWNLFWAYVMYNFGSAVTGGESHNSTIFLIFLCLWLVWDLFNLGYASKVVMNHARAALQRNKEL